MATLAISLAGAAVGSAFGATSLGFLGGQVLGRLLFPADDVVQRGPRLGDLTVSSSAYGSPIRLGFGTIRMAGNVIWSSGLREEKNVSSRGGKGGLGGGGVKQVTYTYFASFAIGFARGPAKSVTRIWADNKLIWDKRGQSNVQKPGLRLRFHPGDETQQPDAIIEADRGAGQTPAFRGLVYLVFDDLELTDFGNRIPNITAEIAFEASDTTSIAYSDDFTSAEGSPFNSFQLAELEADFNRRRLYGLDRTAVGPENVGFRVWHMDTLEEVRQKTAAEMGVTDTAFMSGMTVGRSGYLYGRIGGGNFEAVHKVDPDSLESVATVDDMPNARLISEATAIDPTGGTRKFLLYNSTGIANDLRVINADAMVEITTLSEFDGIAEHIHGAVALPAALGEAAWWLAWKDSGAPDSDIKVYRISVDVVVSVGLFGSSTDIRPKVQLKGTIGPANWNNDSDGFVLGPIHDRSDGGLILLASNAANDGGHVIKWTEANGVEWSTAVSTPRPAVRQPTTEHSLLQDDTFGWVINNKVTLVDTVTGALILDDFDLGTIDADFAQIGAQYYNSRDRTITALTGTGSGTGIVGRAFLERASGQGATVGDVVTSLSGLVGLEAADLDVSELTDTVKGYSVTRQMPARQAVEPLATAFFFDVVEADDVIAFPKRGKAPVRTLQADELPLLEAGGEDHVTVLESRTQEVELPERISVAYMDVDTDYQQGTQSAKRVRQPAPVGVSRNEVTVAFPLVLTPTEAARIVERLLFVAWNGRTAKRWRATQQQLDLLPADVVTLDAEGATARVRIEMARLNGDMSISMEGAVEEQVTFTSTATAQGALGVPQKVAPGPAFTRLFLIDVPLLRDVDDTGGAATLLYFAMNGYEADWPGGTLWESRDGAAFETTGLRALNGVAFGVVQNKLPDTHYPFRTDSTTALRVFMTQGALASVAHSDFLNDKNIAIVGNPDVQNWEVIAFRDAVQQADGSYEVSTLLRARRGTDPRVKGHANGETLIVPAADTMNGVLLGLGRVGNTHFFKGVGFQLIPETAETESLQVTAADLKPRAPVHVKGSRAANGDVTITWTRRTRVAGELVDGTGSTPLGEQSEAYELEIRDGGTLLRTVTGLGSPSHLYTAADYQADSGNASGVIDLTILNPGSEDFLNDWTVESGSFESLASGTDGLLSHGGARHFMGSSGADNIQSQDIDLAAQGVSATAIDAGTVEATFSGWQANSFDQDTGQLIMQFLDTNKVQLGGDKATPLQEITPTDTWEQVSVTGVLPVGTRHIRIKQRAVLVFGTKANSGFDDLALAVDVGDVPPLEATVYQMSAAVGRGFPGVGTV